MSRLCNLQSLKSSPIRPDLDASELPWLLWLSSCKVDVAALTPTRHLVVYVWFNRLRPEQAQCTYVLCGNNLRFSFLSVSQACVTWCWRCARCLLNWCRLVPKKTTFRSFSFQELGGRYSCRVQKSRWLCCSQGIARSICKGHALNQRWLTSCVLSGWSSFPRTHVCHHCHLTPTSAQEVCSVLDLDLREGHLARLTKAPGCLVALSC